MKVIPMIFNTEMVKALLEGRKTVTRRPVKLDEDLEIKDSRLCSFHEQSKHFGKVCIAAAIKGNKYGGRRLVFPPCQPGDLIYVRETFATLSPARDYEECSPNESCIDIRYKASDRLADDTLGVRGYNWKPSIHMPKHCSRLTLRVADVRIERVQDITPDEAKREGFNDWTGFAFAWSSIYGPKKLGWDENPYVWVIEFEVIHKNVLKVAA